MSSPPDFGDRSMIPFYSNLLPNPIHLPAVISAGRGMRAVWIIIFQPDPTRIPLHYKNCDLIFLARL